MKSMWQRTVLKATCLYFFGAVAWILGTDLVLGLIKGISPDFTALGVAKGLCFVAVTSTLLYWILARNLRREHELRVRAEATAAELMDLKIIAEHSGEVFYKHDLEHRFIYVNSRARVLLGYDTDGQGVQWTEVATGNPVNQEAMRATERAIQTGQRQPPFLVELSKKDGSTILFEVEESPMKDAQGKVIAIAGAARDVTAREKAQQALRESEEKFRQVAETIGDGILILENGKCCDCNRRALEILGTEPTALMGRNPLEFSPERQPDGRQSLAAAGQLIQRAAAGEPQCFKWQHRRADGTEFFAELNLRPFNLGREHLVLAVMRDITERIQAEEALRASEERLRALYTSMSEGLAVHQMVCDAEGKAVNYRILDINPAFETITGLSRNRVVGALVTEAYGVEQPPCLERYAAVAETGQAIRLEHYYQPMGRHFAISAFSPRKGQFATVFADITKRKAAEREIFLLNNLYALLSQMNEAIVHITDQDKLLAEACRIAVEHGEFGLVWAGMLEPGGKQVRQVARAGQVEPLTHFASVTADQGDGADPFATALAAGKVSVCMDLQQQIDGGKARDWALASGQRSMMLLPLRVGGEVRGGLWVYSNTPGHFTALVTELMVEVAANLSFALDRIERNRQRELEQRQMRLQHSALEAAANAIVITNHTGVIEWVNEAFTRLTGYSREEVIGKTPRLLRSGAHETRFYARMWDSVLAGKVWQGTITNRRKDGVLYEEEMTVTPVHASGGEVTHFVAIKQDITERKRLELQFLRAQRMQSVGLLAGGVAHDLNNVLAPVLMALPLLRQPLEPVQREQLLETLESSVKRGANIVHQVLTFARGVEVQRVVVQARHLVKEVVKIAEETFLRDILVGSSMPGDLWLLQADPTQIHQVLLNLAVNGRDAMPQGGKLVFTAVNVELTERREFQGIEILPGRYVSLSVSDTGTGIEPEVVERIFEPFFTTKSLGKGTGLGLSTVLGIVKSHGGMVEVQSRPGTGSVFTVLLPAAPADAVSTEEETPHMAMGQGEMILVVDDEVALLHVAQSMLQSQGYHVLTARDGAQGLARFAERRHEIKAVVTDIMMPVMDGVTLARRLRTLNPALPIIASTGLLHAPGDADRAARLRDLGVEHILQKPFQAEELLRTLHDTLRQSRENQPERPNLNGTAGN